MPKYTVVVWEVKEIFVEVEADDDLHAQKIYDECGGRAFDSDIKESVVKEIYRSDKYDLNRPLEENEY